jgi:ribulose-phosphate 3-epimerase
MSFILSSSILSADFAHLSDQIQAAENAGVDWIHIDVMDGSFVPVITMGPFIVETCRRITSLPLDVHLMIVDPEKHIESFARAGATYLSVQIEACNHIYRTLQAIRAAGCHPGVVLNPGTPASSISSVLHLVDHVLVMTVNPGASGQSFIYETLPKVREIHAMLAAAGSTAQIEVDGGITTETLPLVYAAGARLIVAATAVYKYPQGIAQGIQALRACIPG